MAERHRCIRHRLKGINPGEMLPPPVVQAHESTARSGLMWAGQTGQGAGHVVTDCYRKTKKTQNETCTSLIFSSEVTEKLFASFRGAALESN